MRINRRSFTRNTMLAAAGMATISLKNTFEKLQKAEVVNPCNRVPVGLFIDDSTCLVNMAYYGIPQFAEVFPKNYLQDWRKLPREIPDSFVREFGEWSLENGIKGKYSIVPYPACTGWVNRFIPGWTKKELDESLKLVREVIMPNWDIHPEMVSHTRVIDIKTGKPYPFATPEYMENWEWSQNKSTDELTAYQAYALNILKEAGLQCEGITTPGGYAGKNMDNFARSTLQSVRQVYGAEIPHYFRDAFTEKGKSVAPVVRFPSGLDGNDPECVVSVIGCTSDWFGNWDGLTAGKADLFITEDLKAGRMVEVIDSGEPAIMLCHWPGIYFNGQKTGFNILKEVVKRLSQKYDNLIWMKTSELARYWAAKELSTISFSGNTISIKAPFAAKSFTLKINSPAKRVQVKRNGETRMLERIGNLKELKSNTFVSLKAESFICFDLGKGISEIII
jgi:hypothetical protein